MTDFTLTGRHVALIFVSAFTIIIGVNLLLAFSAVRTFPGLEVKNSYVASQSFDERRAAQDALNWTVSTEITDGALVLRIADKSGPVQPEVLRATLGRATHVRDDIDVEFRFDGTALTAPVPPLAPGNWNLRFAAVADDGTEFARRIVLRVAP